MARHFQYFFELTVDYSWCILANPAQNRVVLVMFYAVFLTLLLVDRAKRDTESDKRQQTPSAANAVSNFVDYADAIVTVELPRYF